MENHGLIRIAACSPEVKPADISFNKKEIISIIKDIVTEDVKLAVFPEMSITGYTCADLFNQTALQSAVIPSIQEIASEFKNENIAIVVGAPIVLATHLYNCAVLIHGGKICGIVPKTFIPNYGEFYEKRWFVSGNNISGEIQIPPHNDSEEYNCPIGTDLIFEIYGAKVGIEICEDLWVPIPPSSQLAMSGAEVILNLSATNELIGKHQYLIDLIRNQSARCRCAYAYASAGAGESSTDLAFSGNCIIAENGTILAKSQRFEMRSKYCIADVDFEILRHDRIQYNTFDEHHEPFAIRTIRVAAEIRTTEESLLRYRKINPHPFVDSDPAKLSERCSEISSIQAWGLAVRLRAIGCKTAVIGISGGLDSTLALLVTVKAFDMLELDRKGIIGITMPGFGTTVRTKSNASKLMDLLGVTHMEIPISKAVKQHFNDIGHNGTTPDVTYENSQARERTQILMDVANLRNGIVIGTGDLSELALGWCTYNGDQMSMYGVNVSIPKTLVKYLVNGYAEESDNKELKRVLEDIINTPISPELLPPDSGDGIQQKTEDLVGPYELHDFFLYNALRYGMPPGKIFMLAEKAFDGIYDRQTILHWLKVFYRRFFNQQFKRSCMPDGVKVGNICLSPRGDWRMPSDASAKLWLDQIERLV